MIVELRRHRNLVRVGLVFLASCATTGALVAVVPARAGAVGDPVPTMARTFTKTVAPVPSFVTSAGGPLALTRQTIAGMAAQKYPLTPGITALQTSAVQAGFSASTTYPTADATSVVASAVGVLAAHNTSPVSAAAPGCSRNVGGAARRVVVTSSGNAYRLAVSGLQSAGFRPGGSWRLPAHGSERPLAVTVLETNCSFDASSAIAVTYPSGIDYFAYDGSGNSGWTPAPVGGQVVPTVTWAPSQGAVFASAHVNSDSSYLPVDVPDPESNSPDVGNATMLAVTAATDGSVGLERLELTSLQPGGGQSDVTETGYDVAMLTDGPVTGAVVAYDNRGQGSINDSSYALAVRAGGTTSVWFGLIGRSVSAPDRVIAQDGACAGNALPQLSVATAPGINGSPFTGVVCTVSTGSGTVVQRWSDFTADAENPSPPTFPTAPNPPVTTTLPVLQGVEPFVTWPCVLLDQWAGDQQPTRAACLSDLATDIIGTPESAVARFYQLPTLDGVGAVVSREVAGATAGVAPVVDQLPLARTTLTVQNTTAAAKKGTSPKVPVLYMMPAPMVAGLVQPRTGPPVSFGTTSGEGTSGSVSFSTSVGATVSATVGDPMIAQLELTASAEQATGTTDTNDTTTVTMDTVNNNDNEPFVFYTTTPVWQWTGQVVADSTGVGTANNEQVLTQIARRGATASLNFDSVASLGGADPAFTADGLYGPTLISVFGPGVFGGPGRTVTHADPGTYPTFSLTGSTVPRQGGSTFCDTSTGSTGVTSINSGVASPYTEPDVTAGGPSYLTPSDPPVTVAAGNGGSRTRQVTVSSSQSTSYSTDFSVNTSAGVTIGGLGATLDAGFTIGNQTTVSTSASQFFAAEIGNFRGAAATTLPQGVRDAVRDALMPSETYSWEPFMCRRTTSLPGGGQTAAQVLGFATTGFKGLATVGPTGAPTGVTGAPTAAGAPVVAKGSALRFTRSGPAALYQVAVRKNGSATVTTLSTSPKTPAAATAGPATVSVSLPSGMTPGTYSYVPTAIGFNGDLPAGAARYFKIS